VGTAVNNVLEKIAEYLQHGGLFNPEGMDHKDVGKLILECQLEITRLLADQYVPDTHTVIEKAEFDQPYAYMVGTVHDMVLICSGITTLNNDWVRLESMPSDMEFRFSVSMPEAIIVEGERGLDILKSQIVFAVDAES
jgi:hypothetical protein